MTTHPFNHVHPYNRQPLNLNLLNLANTLQQIQCDHHTCKLPSLTYWSLLITHWKCAFLHFYHPILIWRTMSSSMFLLPWMIEPKYLAFSTLRIAISQILSYSASFVSTLPLFPVHWTYILIIQFSTCSIKPLDLRVSLPSLTSC